MKILSPRPLDEPSVLFSGDVRSRTGVCTNVHTTFLSDCIGFEVLGTSTNNHKGVDCVLDGQSIPVRILG